MRRRSKLPKPSESGFMGRFIPEGYRQALRHGKKLIERGDYSSAESLLTTMSFMYPNGNFLLVLYLADAKFLQGNLEEAEILYRDLIEANFVYPHPRHGLALILQRTDRAEEAKQHIKIVKAHTLRFPVPDYLPPLE